MSIQTGQDLTKLANRILDTQHRRLDNVIHATMTSITEAQLYFFYKIQINDENTFIYLNPGEMAGRYGNG